MNKSTNSLIGPKINNKKGEKKEKEPKGPRSALTHLKSASASSWKEVLLTWTISADVTAVTTDMCLLTLFQISHEHVILEEGSFKGQQGSAGKTEPGHMGADFQLLHSW